MTAKIQAMTAADRELESLREQVAKLQAFKDWVHAYLDTHGVPHHPPGPHGAEGCRIGDRMDWLMARVAGLESALRDVLEVGTEPPVDNGGHYHPACTLTAADVPCRCPACHMQRINDVRRRAAELLTPARAGG
jgi:hypothetical protein